MNGASKAEYRRQLLASRPHSSDGLTQNLIQLVHSLQPKSLASFQPIENEPDLSAFNAWAQPQLSLFFPRVSGENLVFASGIMKKGEFGIWEPTGEQSESLELILVPALAVDRSGNRLGRGKGFYDRALERFPNTAKYAVVFDSEIVDRLPINDWDQKVNGAVTPGGVWNFD